MIGGFNGKLCAQWVGSMGIYYVLNWCAQWESILDAAGDTIVCSTGHYWGGSMEKYSECSLVN